MVTLTNANMAKDLVTSMDSLEVTQVVLVSRTQQLATVQSSNAGCFLSRGETTCLTVQTVEVDSVEEKWADPARLKMLPANVIIPGGRLHFSSSQHTALPTNTASRYPSHTIWAGGATLPCVVMWREGGTPLPWAARLSL